MQLRRQELRLAARRPEDGRQEQLHLPVERWVQQSQAVAVQGHQLQQQAVEHQEHLQSLA